LIELKFFAGLPAQDQVAVMNWIECAAVNANLQRLTLNAQRSTFNSNL
jgi:hypothetical protein